MQAFIYPVVISTRDYHKMTPTELAALHTILDNPIIGACNPGAQRAIMEALIVNCGEADAQAHIQKAKAVI